MNAKVVEGYVPRRFTVAEYYEMTEAGILPPDERTELLHGQIILMAAISPKHASCVDALTKKRVTLALSDRAHLRVQDPLFIDDHTEVRPDIAVVRPASYAYAHPRSEDVLLLVEGADTTVDSDCGIKLQVYSRCGIPEVWLADVNGQVVEVHTGPDEDGYASVQTFGMEGTLTPIAFPDASIAVSDLMRW